MLSRLFFWPKYGRLRQGYSNSPLQDDIPLSQLGQAPTTQPVQDQIIQGGFASVTVFVEVEACSEGGYGRTRNYLHILCYLLHAFLVAIHLTLLAVAACHHPEHRVFAMYPGDAATRLRTALQAFYVLYTALLVFVTQKLMLSAIFSSPRKLTQIHDICGAWAGFGAALSTLWQQTKVASSVWSIAIVATYFACVSVLHITSSTLIQFQSFTEPAVVMSEVVRPWPNASVDLASLDWTDITPMVPFLQNFYSDLSSGLYNNVLYDAPTTGTPTATSNAMVLNAQCGLLTNLSVGALENNTWNINASISGSDHVSTIVSYPPLLNEIWFSPSIQCLEPICSTFILFLVSGEMEVDNLIGDVVNHVYINGAYYSPNGTTLDFSTPVYLVACSLNATNQTVTVNFGTVQVDYVSRPTDMRWSAFSPSGGDLNLTSAISNAIQSANSAPFSSYCQPVMLDPAPWANITIFNAYMILALGMSLSPCYGDPTAQYTSTSVLVTSSQFESTLSQIAAKLIWLASELPGGFEQEYLDYPMPITEQVYGLNINTLPVIIALCMSVILLLLVLCVLWRCPPATMTSAGVLEIMWFGSRSQVLRNHLGNVKSPSMDVLRASAMFETIFWARAGYETCHLYAPAPLCESDPKLHSESSESVGLLESDKGKLHSSNIHQSIPNSTRNWCYVLHVVFVGLHVTLLACLAHHPEQSVVVPYEGGVTATFALSALLQTIYTVYTSVLVLLMQRLALLKMVSERRNLTTVHDVCGAWTGIGAGIQALWKQLRAPSSTWQVFTVVAYLAMMMVLHITSSSIMGWQSYTPVGAIPMDVVMPGSSINISQLDWAVIFPVACLIQDMNSLELVGLQGSTLYDIPQGMSNQYATGLINATTFSAQCGLVPNLTLSSQNSQGEYEIGFLDGANNGSFLELPIGGGLVHTILPSSECIACPQTLFYMITTSIQVDVSVRDPVVVGLNWTSTPSGEDSQNSTTLTYIAACSLSAQTVLQPATDFSPVQYPNVTSTPWSVWVPQNATNISVAMTAVLSKDVTGSSSTGNYSANFTDMDSYIATLLGLVSSEASEASQTGNDVSTLGPSQLETAISLAAATFLWTAGQLGEAWGGFQYSVSEVEGATSIDSWQLHLNTIPVLVASIASFLSLILAMTIVGKGPSREHPTLISGTSVLECLWLEARSELLHSRLQGVEGPSSNALRAGGMFQICLGNIGLSSLPEAQEPMLEVADE